MYLSLKIINSVNRYLHHLQCTVQMFITNKVALITGGASGIGYCYALALLKNGIKAVTLADVDEAKGEEALTEITKDFGPNKALFIKTDVTDKNQVKNVFQKTIEQFNQLDIVINNAGVMNDLIWEKQIAINLNGTIHGCLLAMEEYLPKYKSGDEGVIVNISSIFGVEGVPILPFYSATKHAIIGLGKSLGNSEHYETTKVRVLTLCPGATMTALLDDLDKKTVNDRYLALLGAKDRTEDYPLQTVDEVPKCLLKILEEGTNGSTWIVEAGEIYEIEFPTRHALKKKL